MNKGEADFVTSSIGLIAYLMWHDIYPDDLTFDPHRACIYRCRKINWPELINSYWLGEKLPICELSECIVVSERILNKGEINHEWYKELKEALDDLRADYVFPVM